MKIFFTILLVATSIISKAQYTTPNTGLVLTPADLVALSNGVVTFNGTDYLVNADVTISSNDKLEILNNATFKFATARALFVNGRITVDPPTRVLFTAQNPLTGFNGVRLDAPAVGIFKKLTFEYGISFRIVGTSPSFNNCIFQYNNNNSSTTFGNGAMALSNSNPIITDCIFTNNQRAAIQGAANIGNAPKITNCYFAGNNITNQNVPQINLGPSGVTDTTVIINCKFFAASTRSGAIGFLPLGTLNTVIKNNLISKNRYGITISGGNNINATIAYNRIEDNNTEGNPALGGSGISLSGGSATSHQNTIITGNYLKGNLWGITILNFAKPNLGNTTNTDTTDDGKNIFIANANTTETQADLYNNTPDSISAQGNYWNSFTTAAVENKIFHKTDNNVLGLVNYSDFIMPTAPQLTATAVLQNVQLQWANVATLYIQNFEIEKSSDIQNFTPIAAQQANNAGSTYTYNDAPAGTAGTRLYYRLKQNDLFGNTVYSNVATVLLSKLDTFSTVTIYPTITNSNQSIYAAIQPAHAATITVTFFDIIGRRLAYKQLPAAQGSIRIQLNQGLVLPKGVIIVKVEDGAFIKQVSKIIVQ